jgi:hypothetical protein
MVMLGMAMGTMIMAITEALGMTCTVMTKGQSDATGSRRRAALAETIALPILETRP